MIGNKNADIIRAIKNKKCCKDVVLESLNVTENNTYTAEEGKAWNEVNVNVQGGGTFNINDIVLADDLLEKCQALGLQVGEGIDTDWTFEDICKQDSCGVLQSAFEQSDVSSFSALTVFYGDPTGINCGSSRFGEQVIHIPTGEGGNYEIAYFDGKYNVDNVDGAI